MSIHLLMDIWVASPFSYCEQCCQEHSFVSFHLNEHLVLILLGLYQGLEMLGYMFNILRKCQTLFHDGYTILHSYQQSMRVSVSSHSCQDLLFPLCLQLSQCSVVLYFDFHFPNDIQHLFMCLSAIYISSQKNRLFMYFAYIFF